MLSPQQVRYPSCSSCAGSSTMAPGKRKASGSPRRDSPAPKAPGSRFLPCPTCGNSFAQHAIEAHAWQCMPSTQTEEQQQPPGEDASGKVEEQKNFAHCPICSKSFPKDAIEAHAWQCLPSTKTTDPAPAAATATSPAAAGAAKGEKSATEEDSPECIAITKRDPSPMPSRHDTGDSSAVSAGDASVPKIATVTDPSTSACGSAAFQRLMEGGRRASKAERDLKTVPPSWPVECLEDILPLDKADRLLTRMLHVSRSWTSQPWYNNNGVEGTTHSRSQVFSIPMSADIGGDGGGNDISDTTQSTTQSTHPAEASSGEAQRHSTPTPTDEPERSAENGGSSGHAGATTSKKRIGHTVGPSSKPETSQATPHTSEGEDTDGGDGGGGGAVASSRRDATAAAPTGDVVDEPARATPPRSSRSSSKENEYRRRATHDDLMLGEATELAPEELLEVIPLIVRAVRRRQRQRMEQGLDGQEGLTWNPNFCLCHVYDDQRNHLGAHSDGLSNIGPRAVVVGISLGAKRVFMVQETVPWGVKTPSGSGQGGDKKFLDMPHNSAIVMWAGCQERYKHGVPSMTKGVKIHPTSGTKRISITLRERKEALPKFLLPIPDCRCGVQATLKARVLKSGAVDYLFQCDRGQGQCGFFQSRGGLK